MPNLMCNHLIIHGERAVEIMRSVLVESEETDCGYELDFEKIVPMPEELNTYGNLDSCDWREHNWGTKWNAYHTQINDIEKADIYFDTAGSQVPQIIKALSEKYPDCKFEYEYAEERAGGYAGFYDYENGIAVSYADYDEGCKEAYQMFFALWGQEDEFKFNPKTNTYEPIDEEVM